jgi:hypothetical protein
MGYLKAPKINTSARMTSAWAASELLYDTDLNAFFKGDGTTTGGVRLAEGDLASVLSIISALEARVSALSATPAGVSVTSNELSIQIASAVSNLRSVINVVSNTVSVNNAARISVDNVLSNAISVVSNALSVETQARTTADNALSNTISALNSSYLSLVNRVSVNSVVVSVTSAEVQAVSTQAASAINVVSNALSNELSVRATADNVLSQAIVSVNAAISNALSLATAGNNLASNALSIANLVSNNLSILSNQNSADHVSIRNLISIVSVAAANALSIANAASNAASVLSVALANELSVRAAADANILSLISVLEARVSANSGAGGSGSVTSTELSNALSVVSAQAASAINVVSNALSVETAARISSINVLSNTISNLTSAVNALSAAAGNSVTSAEVAQVLSNALSAVNALNLSDVVSVGNSTSLEIQVSGVRTPHVQFNPSVSAPNTSIYSLTKDVDYNLVNYQALSALGFIIPQDDIWAVKNQTASLIPKGSAVMAVGTTGASGRITVDLMVANGSVSPVYLLGVTAVDIPSGADGFLLNKGKIKKLNTNAWTAGTILYCDPAVPGGLTSTIPQAPNLKVPIAFVVYQNAINGILAVRKEQGARLRDDHDVQLTSVTDGDLLRYNLSAQRWENFVPDYATSNALSTLSNQNSVDHVSIRNLVSIVSVAAANALSVANAVSNKASALSVLISNTISDFRSADNVLSNQISVVSVAAANALSVANAASNAASIVSVALANELSVRAAADTNILSIISVLEARVSANSGTGGGPILVSGINAAGASVQGLQSVVNALSNRISVLSAVGGGGGGGGTVLSPSQITAWQNNYNPSSWANTVGVLRINSNQFHFLSGLTATSDGHTVRIFNTGSYPIGLYNQNTDSTAANRFSFDDHDVIILPQNSVELYYDGTASRWSLAAGWTLNSESAFVSKYWNEAFTTTGDNHGATAALWGVSGGTATASTTGGVTGARVGIVDLATGVGTTGRAAFYPSANNQMAYDDGTGKSYMEFKAEFRSPAALSDATNEYFIHAGFIDTVTADSADGAFLKYTHGLNSGQWQFLTADNTTRTTGNSTVAMAINTWYCMRVVMYPNGTAEYYIDGVSLGRNTANLPSNGRDFSFGIGIRKTAGTTARNMLIDGAGYTVVKYRK